MRQSGILAAAAHVALDGAERRLKADHENAKIIVESKSLGIYCKTFKKLFTTVINFSQL
jgi:hypothetical protein